MAQEKLVEAPAKCNRTEVAWRRSGEEAAESARLKAARKDIERSAKQAKANFIAKTEAEAKGGARSHWEAVRAIHGADSGAKEVKTQKNIDSDGSLCKTPAEKAAAAAAHYTSALNTTCEEYEEKAPALNEVRHRDVGIELDSTISMVSAVLQDAKPGKATSGQVPVEPVKA